MNPQLKAQSLTRFAEIFLHMGSDQIVDGVSGEEEVPREMMKDGVFLREQLVKPLTVFGVEEERRNKVLI